MEKAERSQTEKQAYTKIYEVEGSFNKDFVGQVSYTVCLSKTYRELDIEFSFEKQHYTPADLTPALKEEVRRLCWEKYGKELSEEALEHLLLKEMKTELHTIAMLNEQFIGGVHRQLTTRHMHFTSTEATEGCIPQTSIEGVLKVILVAFNVLMDNTRYRLIVRAR